MTTNNALKSAISISLSYREKFNQAYNQGLIKSRKNIDTEALNKIILEHNLTLEVPSAETPAEKPQVKYVDIASIPVQSSHRETMDQVIHKLDPATPIEVPVEDPWAADLELLMLQNPELAARLQQQFNELKKSKKTRKTSSSSSSSNKQSPEEKRAKIAVHVAKHREIYFEYLAALDEQRIANPDKDPVKSKAEIKIAYLRSTTPGAVGFYVIAYLMYLRYSAVRLAVDSGDYPLSKLGKDATKKDRSALLSEHLEVDISISIEPMTNEELQQIYADYPNDFPSTAIESD